MIGYFIFGAPNALLLGFLTCFATVIPMVGTGLIWFPVAVYMALTGDWPNAIGLAAYGGIIVSQLDNLIRFILQKKMADTHPLITIFSTHENNRLAKHVSYRKFAYFCILKTTLHQWKHLHSVRQN